MEKVPSPHLFRVFNPADILRVLGVPCNKDRPPFAVSCPKCRKSCWVHGVSPFGGWLNCTHCGLTGDPIRVYQQTYGIKTLETTINHLTEEVKGPAPRQTDLDLYEVFHYNYYNKIERFWKTCQHRAANENQPFHAQRLYELGLWRDSHHFNKYFKDLTTEELIDDAIHAAHCAFSRLKKEKGMINYMGSYVFGHCMRQLNCRNTQLSPEHKSQPVIERPLAPTSNTQIEYYYDRFTPAFTVEETAFDILLAKENSHKESQKEFLQRAIEANPKFGFVVEIMKRKFNGEPVRDVAKEYGWNGTNFIYWKRKLVKHLSYCQLAA